MNECAVLAVTGYNSSTTSTDVPSSQSLNAMDLIPTPCE